MSANIGPTEYTENTKNKKKEDIENKNFLCLSVYSVGSSLYKEIR